VALKHGAGRAWVLGKIDGLRLFATYRRAGGESIGSVLGSSEKQLRELQQRTGWDWYWRLYFALTWAMAGVVIVTYNSASAIGRCLDACLEQGLVDVVVVDNASEDGTAAEASQRRGVRVIANSTNRGFAAAVNQGFQSLQTETVLVLNPDTLICAGLENLEAAVRQDDVGAGTGTLIGPDGKPQHGFNVRAFPTPLTLVFELLGVNRLWPSNPVNRRYRLCLSPNDTVDIEQPAGAFLMVKRVAWRTVGGFDEEFHPVWFEDVDFCKRLLGQGFRILYVPSATAVHAGGDSVSRMPWIVRQQVWYGSLLRYASKHYTDRSVRSVAIAVIIGCTARAVGRAVGQFSLAPFTAWSRVVRLTSPYLRTGDRGRKSRAACSATEQSKSRF
jgi:N-acetylglucosaminyl-diphospho-decaprenol L-rhamnosyltransferase